MTPFLKVCDGTVRVRRLFVNNINPAELDSEPIFFKKSQTEERGDGSTTEVYGGPNFEQWYKDRTLFEHVGECQGEVSVSNGCILQDHLDFVPFRDAGDGYGWAIPIVTHRDYFVDFGGFIDFQSMKIRYSEPFYVEHYTTPDNDENVLLKFPYKDYRYRFAVESDQTRLELPWYDRQRPHCIGNSCPYARPQAIPPLTRHSAFGTGYMVREDESLRSSGAFGVWAISLNPFLGVELEDDPDKPAYPYNSLQVSVEPKQCAPLMGCAGPSLTRVDPNGEVWKWSDVETWEAIYQMRSFLWDVQANPNNTFPIEGEHVEIPGGFHIVLDVPPCRTHPDVKNCIPKLGRFTVSGKFTFDDGDDRELSADTILVWGEFEVGTRDKPFQHNALILLNGNPASPTLVASEMHYVGNKVVAVFGNLTLHGKKRSTRFVKLLQTAFAGSRQLTLKERTDWKVGDEIVLTPTSYIADEVETTTIAKISEDGRSLYLEKSLNHTHKVTALQLGEGKAPIHLAAVVGILTGSNVVLDSNFTQDEIDAGWSAHGFHIVVGEHIYEGAAIAEPRRGSIFGSGVNFRHCGQTGSEHPCIMMRYFSGMSEKYKVFDWFFEKNDGPNNKILDSSFHNTLNGAVSGQKAFGFVFDGNVVHRTYVLTSPPPNLLYCLSTRDSGLSDVELLHTVSNNTGDEALPTVPSS